MDGNQARDNQRSAEFLLTMYNQLNEETRRLRGEGLSRLNFFIAISSTALAALVVLAQINAISILEILSISVGVTSFLILLGWPTFTFTVSRDISTDLNLRAMGRITRYFIDHDESLYKYLTWRLHDEPTKWIENDNNSGIRNVCKIILGTLIGVNFGLISYSLTFSLNLALIIGLSLFLISLVGLNAYTARRFEYARKKAQKDIRFPKLTRMKTIEATTNIPTEAPKDNAETRA